MLREIDVIGVPSSAGAHGPGQEKAPAALRNAGLLEKLKAGGLKVADALDLPLVRFAPDPAHRKSQSAMRVREVALRVADAVDRSVRGGKLPLVLGGDCSITLGVVSGLARSKPDLGLLYFDGDADLTTPSTTRSGIFDSMVMGHMIGGGDEQVARIGPRYPLLSEDRIVLFGFLPYEMEADEQTQLSRSPILQYPAPSLGRPPLSQAREARERLEAKASSIVLHFDVDVMDSAEIPLANWPHYEALSLDDAMQALTVFVGSDKLAAMVMTEINPDHDPDGLLLRRLVDGLSRALRPLAEHRVSP